MFPTKCMLDHGLKFPPSVRNSSLTHGSFICILSTENVAQASFFNERLSYKIIHSAQSVARKSWSKVNMGFLPMYVYSCNVLTV